MNGISRKNYRRAGLRGNWAFGKFSLPAGIEQALGRALSEWGFVEAQMDALLSATVGNAGVGKVLRKELRASKQRRQIIGGLVEVTTPPDLHQKVAMLVGDFNRLAEERGLYAHCPWGTHTAYPDDAVLLLDGSVVEGLYPDIEAIAAGTGAHRDFLGHVRDNSALVSVRDLDRFSRALKKLSGRLAETILELSQRSSMEKIRAMAALERFSTAPSETNSPPAPDVPSE